LLVCSSSLAEDFYPLVTKRELTPKQRLDIGRVAVVILALLATTLAMQPDSKVLDVVSYAWAGLGASVGPAVAVSLYWRKMTARGALAGITVGGLTVIIWSQLEGGWFDIYSLVPGFALSILAIMIVSAVDKTKRSHSADACFDKMIDRLSE
jgi:sodium/proline symporter